MSTAVSDKQQEASMTGALLHLQTMAEDLERLTPDAMSYLRRLAREKGGTVDRTVLVQMGETDPDTVRLIVTAIESGHARKIIMVPVNPPGSVHHFLGEALKQFAESKKVDVLSLLEDREGLFRPGHGSLPSTLPRSVKNMGADQALVINSIPSRIPPAQFPDRGKKDLWTPNILPDGRLKLVLAGVASPRDVQIAIHNKGTLPGLWHILFSQWGLLGPDSIFVTSSWGGRMKARETESAGEERAIAMAAERNRFSATYGHNVIIKWPATMGILRGVAGGLLEFVVRRDLTRATAPNDAELGALILASLVDPSFEHPGVVPVRGSMQKKGVILRFDAAEQQASGQIKKIMDYLDRQTGIPAHPLALDSGASREMLSSAFDAAGEKLSERWRDHLALATLLFTIERVPETPETPPLIPEVIGPAVEPLVGEDRFLTADLSELMPEGRVGGDHFNRQIALEAIAERAREKEGAERPEHPENRRRGGR